MQGRYVPPHLRKHPHQPQPAPAPAPTPPSTRPSPIRNASGGPSRPAPHRASPALTAPAADIRPMRSTPRKENDEMEMIQSVSRSGGDGAEGDALKSWETQDRYRQYIDERLDKHYLAYPRARDAAPPVKAQDELHSLGSIVLLFRKLREGVVASDRIDAFALEVFESSARLAILARNTAQLLSSLSGLVPGLYRAVDPKGKGRAGAVGEDELVASLGALDVRDDRAEFASILLLFHLAHTNSREAYHNTLVDLTSPTVSHLSTPLEDTSRRIPGPTEPPFVSRSSIPLAIRASRALAEETFDPVLYFKVVNDPSAGSPYERAVLSWAEGRVRERAWRVMSKVYLGCGLEWAGRWGGMDGAGWAEERGASVEAGKVKLR